MNRIWLPALTGALLFLAAAGACHAETRMGKPHYCTGSFMRMLPDPDASGMTTLTFTVTEAGSVADASVADSSGNPSLDAASLACVQRWRYMPAMQDSKPVAARWSGHVILNPKAHPLAIQILRDCGKSLAQTQHVTARRETGFLLTYDDEKRKLSAVTVAHPSGDDALDRAETDCLAGASPEPIETVVALAHFLAEPYPDTFNASLVFADDGSPGFEIAAEQSSEWRDSARIVPEATDTDLISVIVAKANAHLLMNKYDLAANEFGIAIARYPDRPDFYEDRCRAYVISETHYDLAVADCEKAVALAEKQSHPPGGYYAERAQAYAGSGKYAQAVADYDRAIAMEPKRLRLLLYRCEARAAWGNDLRSAWNDCASYTNQTDGGDARGHEAMSLIRCRLQDYPAAIQQADLSLALGVRRAPALYLRGIAKLKSGDKSGGSADMRAAQALDRKIGETYAGYGVVP